MNKLPMSPCTSLREAREDRLVDEPREAPGQREARGEERGRQQPGREREPMPPAGAPLNRRRHHSQTSSAGPRKRAEQGSGPRYRGSDPALPRLAPRCRSDTRGQWACRIAGLRGGGRAAVRSARRRSGASAGKSAWLSGWQRGNRPGNAGSGPRIAGQAPGCGYRRRDRRSCGLGTLRGCRPPLEKRPFWRRPRSARGLRGPM